MMKFASALLVAASLLVPGTATAQDEGGGGNEAGCGLMGICSGGHKVNGPSPTGVQYPHQDCLVCITQGGCHPGCDEVLGPSLRPVYVLVLQAANEGDAAAILRLASKAPGFVSYNAERKSIQVASCNRSAIVANLPLRSSSEIASAAKLPGAALIPASTLTASR